MTHTEQRDQLATKWEKATFTGAKIAELAPIARKNRGVYDIQIIGMNPIPGGVEVYARVWDGAGQIGFGGGSTVDVERFTFINPSFHVHTGTFSRQTRDYGRLGVKKEMVEDFVEDLEGALLRMISETVKITKPEGSAGAKIKAGKVGRSTLTVYPVSGSNSPVDGWASVPASGQDTFANLRAAAGSNASATTTYCDGSHLEAGTSSNNFNYFSRGFVCFDTSPIGSGGTISAAVLSLYGNGNYVNTFSVAPSLHICAAALASTAAVVAGDFDSASFTSFGSKTFAAWSVGALNDITFNASGIAAINKTGISQFSIQSSWDQSNTAPTWGSGLRSYMYSEMADNADSAKWPKLVVTYTSSTTYNETYTESVTWTDTLIRQAGRIFSEAATWTDVFTGVKALLRTLTESITWADVFSRQVGKVLAEAATWTDVFTRQANKVLVEASTWTDVLVRGFGKVLTETATWADNLRIFVNGFLVGKWRRTPRTPKTWNKTPRHE